MPRYDKRTGGTVAQWLALNWRALVSELMATSLLVAFGCGSCLPKSDASREPAPLVHPALGFAFFVVALSVAFGIPSGAHMNPAVSWAAVIMKRLSPALALAYSVMQVVGATLGYMALAAIVPAAREAPAGITLPAKEISALGATMLELAMTALLVLTVCAVWVSPPDPTAPLKVGMLVGGLVLAGGWMTGTSLNPARSIGPVIYHNHWTNHWVYWVGPMAGALVGVGLHVVLHPATAPWRPLAPATPPLVPAATAATDSALPNVFEDDQPDDELSLQEKQPTLRDNP